ncbi:UDP-glycosyltransferase UGT5-like [Episyrphus balteatus]|uniref:UDP-glycosyltransferase UGT5-like n=1 Tax=Episyrphus balteatus TaxID=286459 RepID=UPI002485FCCF|nr:UDP-glycosyltransferase UGT5-like [Episyrphus balteatus]
MIIFIGLFGFVINNLIFNASGANILGLMGVSSPSHHIWNSVLMHRLADLGHNVTVLSVDLPRPNEKLPPNLHYIHLENGYSVTGVTSYIGMGVFEFIPIYYGRKLAAMEVILQSKGMQQLLNYPDSFKFDVILYDYIIGPYLLGFVHKFNYPPLIGMSAFHNPPITMDLMSNHYFPAYIPYHSTTYSPVMDFWQRLENTLIFMADTAYRRMVFVPRVDDLVRPYFSSNMSYLGDISKHTAIALVNSHPAINFVEPLPPNVIEVGGMQMLEPKPLPKDLEEFLNKSKDGAIFISFGTNMKSQDFTVEQVDVIVNAMAELPQYNFMWKFDVKYLKRSLPENVLAKTNFPQTDVLAHPKLKAFVTHCGGLSSQEAMWRGVPMVGVPLFFDQHRNLRQSMDAGIAVKLDFLTMTTEDLVQAIKKVIEDPQMRQKIKEKSNQFQNRPMKPLETAVWWVEYILQNPNPYHLKSHAERLNIFQANSLDCILFILAVGVSIISFVVIVVVFVWRKISNILRPAKVKTN